LPILLKPFVGHLFCYSSFIGYIEIELMASSPNQLIRVFRAVAESSCVNKSASRFFGLEQAT